MLGGSKGSLISRYGSFLVEETVNVSYVELTWHLGRSSCSLLKIIEIKKYNLEVAQTMEVKGKSVLSSPKSSLQRPGKWEIFYLEVQIIDAAMGQPNKRRAIVLNGD